MVVYVTTNLVNGKRYIGRDFYDSPEYLGSGTLLRRAINKYGIENFEKVILEHCDTDEQLSEREAYWIEHFNAVESPMYYNIARGGKGGDCITGLNPEAYVDFCKKQSDRMYGVDNPMTGKTHSDESRLKMHHPGEKNGMYGKTHSTKTKAKQKAKATGRYTLEWFIERKGAVNGPIEYRKRCDKLKARGFSGKGNPAYRYIDLNELERLIIETDYNLKQICEELSAGSTQIYHRLRTLYNCKNLKEARIHLAAQRK